MSDESIPLAGCEQALPAYLQELPPDKLLKVFTTQALYGKTAVIVASDKKEACKRLRALYKRLRWRGAPDPKYVHEVDLRTPCASLHGGTKEVY
jgi:hypothetical protein